MERHVVIKRAWSDPQISTSVSVDADKKGIAVRMPLVDFVRELAAEVGNPTLLVTRAALLTRLQAAAELVCREMKQATSKVM